jgi:hypothetical protein
VTRIVAGRPLGIRVRQIGLARVAILAIVFVASLRQRLTPVRHLGLRLQLIGR